MDTHCHIHESDYPLDIPLVMSNAAKSGVDRLVCVGTDLDSSHQAVQFVQKYENCWASIGIHPHEANDSDARLRELSKLLDKDFNDLSEAPPQPDNSKSSTIVRARTVPEDNVIKSLKQRSKVVAIGECGLDYFYEHSTAKDQEKALRFQIELALKHDLPMIFHVREAFDDFWPIFDSYSDIRGVVHSYTDNLENLEKIIERDLFVGVNGIATFAKSKDQIEMYGQIPLSNLLLETDSPFLTPVPKRGTMNEPANVWLVAKFLSELRGEGESEIAHQTSANAEKLFNLR